MLRVARRSAAAMPSRPLEQRRTFVYCAPRSSQGCNHTLQLTRTSFSHAGSIKTGYDTVRYAMGMTDKVVGTGMLSFITLGGKDSPVDPKEPAQEQLDGRRGQPPRAPQRDGQPAEKQ